MPEPAGAALSVRGRNPNGARRPKAPRPLSIRKQRRQAGRAQHAIRRGARERAGPPQSRLAKIEALHRSGLTPVVDVADHSDRHLRQRTRLDCSRDVRRRAVADCGCGRVQQRRAARQRTEASKPPPAWQHHSCQSSGCCSAEARAQRALPRPLAPGCEPQARRGCRSAATTPTACATRPGNAPFRGQAHERRLTRRE